MSHTFKPSEVLLLMNFSLQHLEIDSVYKQIIIIFFFLIVSKCKMERGT